MIKIDELLKAFNRKVKFIFDKKENICVISQVSKTVFNYKNIVLIQFFYNRGLNDKCAELRLFLLAAIAANTKLRYDLRMHISDLQF